MRGKMKSIFKNKMHKKGQTITFSSLVSIVLVMVVAVLVIVVGSVLINQLRDDTTVITADSEAFNISNNGLNFFTNLSSQFPLLGTIITLVLVISVIIAAFAFGRGGKGGGGL